MTEESSDTGCRLFSIGGYEFKERGRESRQKEGGGGAYRGVRKRERGETVVDI